MEAINQMTRKKETAKTVRPEDDLAVNTIKYAQGLGAVIRYANELHAVKQVGRLPSLPSSRLHEDVLKGNLGAGTGFGDIFGERNIDM